MSKVINVIDDPQHFLAHATRVASASNISLEKKQQWLLHHLGTLVEYAATGPLDLPYIVCLQKLAECSQIISDQELAERARERAIAATQKAAEEKAGYEAWRDQWTAAIQAEIIAKQRERDAIIEQKELAREANIRLNAIVYKWNREKARWFRMVPSLRRGAFQDFSYQGAD